LTVKLNHNDRQNTKKKALIVRPAPVGIVFFIDRPEETPAPFVVSICNACSARSLISRKIGRKNLKLSVRHR